MAYRSKDKDLKRAEVFFLASVMNPLPKAAEAARKDFEQHRPLPLMLSSEDSYSQLIGYYDDQQFKPESLQEEFTEAFLDGVEYGYNRRGTRSVEAKLRREALLKAAAAKKELFRLLDLPDGMQRGVKPVASRLMMHRFADEELKASLKRIEDDIK